MLQRILDLLGVSSFLPASGTIPQKFLKLSGTGAMFAYGTTVPTDAGAGYAPGCIFVKTDGSAGSILYVNNGSATSCLFVQLVPSTDEVVITTKAVAASESGKTFFLSLVGGFTVTLPAPAIGLKYRFIVKIAPTTAYIIVTNGGANLMYGQMVERAGGAGVAGAARDTFNFVASQAIIGDWVEFYSDGTSWFYHGMVDVAAGNTVAQT